MYMNKFLLLTKMSTVSDCLLSIVSLLCVKCLGLLQCKVRTQAHCVHCAVAMNREYYVMRKNDDPKTDTDLRMKVASCEDLCVGAGVEKSSQKSE